jgi:amino acid permease
MAPDELFTREDALAGLPARRASTLLFLIESRTAHLVARSRRAMELFLSEDAARERDLAYFEAFSLARQPPLKPPIQDLERYALQWADLVPASPRLRAAIAHTLGTKYVLTCKQVPGLQEVLGLHTEPVQQAYQRLYRQPLDNLYTARPTLGSQLRWAFATLSNRLESLSSFWTAYALTLTETVGAGILALPIALAELGPLAGVVLLVIFGLFNVLTVAFMAEAVSRSGTIRYGSGFIGRAVEDYLGGAGSLVLSVGLMIICFVMTLAYYIGFASTMADATAIPVEMWVALLFLVGLYFLRRESLDATAASALLVGAVNIGLILILSILSLAHLSVQNLLYLNLPFVNGRPFDASILQLIFGVVFTAYFGHLSVSNCGRVVLRRDASGRSLIWGTVAAQGTAILLYSLWVVAVNGAIEPASLAGLSGTALAPLADRLGPIVYVLGSIFVLLGMGMASIHMSLGLFNLVRERIPLRHQPVVSLARRRGRLILYSKKRAEAESGPRLGLTYLGLVACSGQPPRPQFRLDLQVSDRTHRLDLSFAERWDTGELPERLGGQPRPDIPLSREVVDVEPETVSLRVSSLLKLVYEGEWDTCGLGAADLLTLPDSWRSLVTWIMRQGEVSLADVAARLQKDRDEVQAVLDALADEGFVQESQGNRESRYRVRLAPKAKSQLSEEAWQTLGYETPAGPAGPPQPTGVRAYVSRMGDTLLSEWGRFLVSVSPVVLVFLLVEWLFLTGAESFAKPISFLGVIVVSLLTGIFPVLLLISSRRKGELVPGVVYRILGNPLLLGAIYLISLSGLFLHGLVIWEGPVERGGALFVGVFMVVLTVALLRRGAFAPRAVVQLVADQSQGGEATFSVIAGGQPAEAKVQLTYPGAERHIHAASGQVPDFDSLRAATARLPVSKSHDLKVWALRLTLDGDSEALPAIAEVQCGPDVSQLNLKLSGGHAVHSLGTEPCQVRILLPESSAREEP